MTISTAGKVIRAVYRHGDFHALDPIDLPDGALVELTFEVAAEPTAARGSASDHNAADGLPMQALEAIWAARNSRGAIPRTAEEIDADIAAQRQGWDDRLRRLNSARHHSVAENESP